jgi:ferredoxin-type protein NapH
LAINANSPPFFLHKFPIGLFSIVSIEMAASRKRDAVISFQTMLISNHGRNPEGRTMRRQTGRKIFLTVSFILFQTFLLFHLFFSPVLVIFAASQGVINGSLVIFVLLFLTSLFFGRAFCGWVCPGSGLNELCALVTTKRASGGNFRKTKYAISGVWLSIIALLALSVGGFHSIDLFYGTGISTLTQEIIMFFGVIAMIVPAALVIGTRANCKYICWLAPIMIAGTAIRNRVGWPALHLEANADLCVQCGTCNDACSMNLDVMNLVLINDLYQKECILCGSCIDACPYGVISYAL